MLLNKYFYFSLLILSSIIFISCGEEEPSPDLVSQYNNPSFVLKEAKSAVGENVRFAYKGSFDNDTIIEVAAGEEISNQDEWGIKFYLLKLGEKELSVDYETDILNGSFNECLVKTIKFPGIDYELIYYNSQAYFLGSGGGEIFTYILDLNTKQAYYAHLINDSRMETSLYLSENIQPGIIKDFFMGVFRKDYPDLKMISEDVDLSY